MQSAIADDVLLNRLSADKPVSDKSSHEASFVNDGARPGAFVQSFECLVDHWVGYLVLVSQDFDDGGKNVSRSAAVRVDNITEVIGVLEVLFKR